MAQFWKITQQNNPVCENSLGKMIPELVSERRVTVSFVGAGGKTTSLFFLGRELAGQGKKVLLYTTTHMQNPKELLSERADQVRQRWELGQFAILGTPEENSGKIGPPEASFLEEMKREADAVLVEADGAGRKPCKIPRKWEPVIPEDTELVIGVLGLTALAGPWEDVVFHPEYAKTVLSAHGNTDLSEHGELFLSEQVEALRLNCGEVLLPKTAAKILQAEWGTRKNVGERGYYVLLNQCDNQQAFSFAQEVKEHLTQISEGHIIFSTYQEAERKR